MEDPKLNEIILPHIAKAKENPPAKTVDWLAYNADQRLWAPRYLALAWPLFLCHSIDEYGNCTCGNPDCESPGKHPIAEVCPRGVKNATTDLATILEWLRRFPRSNLAIATGKRSRITVLDIDKKKKNGIATYTELNRDYDEPQTLRAITPSGGFHDVFRYNSALKTCTDLNGHEGIDCRNDNNGHIVACPSRHKAGTQYAWDNWTDPPTLEDLPAHLTKKAEKRGPGRPRKNDPHHGSSYTPEQIEDMMMRGVPQSVIEHRDYWRHAGLGLGRYSGRSEWGWELYKKVAARDTRPKGRNHDEIMHQAFWELSKEDAENTITIGTFIKIALEAGWAPKKTGQSRREDFYFNAPGANYLYVPKNEQWTGASVDACVGQVNVNGKLILASEYLKEHQRVTSITSDPQEPLLIEGKDFRDGGFIEVPNGARTFNTYRRSNIVLGKAELAQPFVDHVYKVFNKDGDADLFLDFMAHRVRFPGIKPRFALLLGGEQGCGKDTAIEFCYPAIGLWNVAAITPAAFNSSFNEYAKQTLVNINELANLQEQTRWLLNEQVKTLIAGSPDVVEINPKYGKKYYVRMHCGVVATTNHLDDGVYIPTDDRRFDVIECATLLEMGLGKRESPEHKEYFKKLRGWFGDDPDVSPAAGHIAAFLHERDLSEFNPYFPRTTAAKTRVIMSGHNDEWLGDILDQLDWPTGVRGDFIFRKAVAAGEKETDVRRKLLHTIRRLGYVLFPNPNNEKRTWKIQGKHVTVYVKAGTPHRTYDPVKELAFEPIMAETGARNDPF